MKVTEKEEETHPKEVRYRSMLTAEWETEVEVKARISVANEAVNIKKNIFQSIIGLPMRK